MAILKVENLTKHFGGLQAVDNVNFEVKEGECLGLIGPNGAGKTTLFQLISGFLQPNEGKVWFKGKNVVGKSPHKLVERGLARTFQLIKTFKHLTVWENLVIPSLHESHKHSKDKESRKKFAQEVLKTLDLERHKDMLAKNLSQGELKRLTIGIAFATKPDLLLLDEPFAGLSPQEIKEVEELINKLKGDGVTQIVVEHKLKELFKLSERVMVLDYGKLIFKGTPEEAAKNKKVIEAYMGQEIDFNSKKFKPGEGEF